ncbi:MAG: hypothetical protein VX409_06340 [Verrucomicrobiota bacterium]|nr:hypothetical protein [Verrucomicrobiota bacterium]
MLDNFLSENLFKQLSDEFPTEEWFLKNKKQKTSGGRLDIFKGEPVFCEFLQQSKGWSKFFDSIDSQAFLELLKIFGSSTINNGGEIYPKSAKLVEYNPIVKKFGLCRRVLQRAIRDSRLRALSRFVKAKLNPEEYYFELNLGYAYPGYYVGPHTDNRHKWLVFIIYFDNFEGKEGGLNILEERTPTRLREAKRYPKRDDLRIVKTIASKPNRFVSFINCNNSYHETVPWTFGRTRRFLYASISKKHCESMWRSSIFTLFDAMPKNYKTDGEPLPQKSIDDGVFIE